MASNNVHGRFVGMAIAFVLACAWCGVAAEEKPVGAAEHPFYPQSCFGHGASDPRFSTPAEQMKLLRELGYDGYAHYKIDGLAEVLKALDENHLQLFQWMLHVPLGDGKPKYDARMKEAFGWLKWRPTVIALLIDGGPTDPAERERLKADVVRDIADMAAAYDLRVAVLPYYETLENTLRVVKKADRKNAGVIFSQIFYFLMEDEKRLEEALKPVMPHLFVVNINGVDRGITGRRKDSTRLTYTLDRGTFDNLVLLKVLHKLGYPGPIGLECCYVYGNPEDNLTRSMQAWQKLLSRMEAEPFTREVDRALPPEQPYDYHKRLAAGPVHWARLNPEAKPQSGEMALPPGGWKLVWNRRSGPILKNAVADFQDYLIKSMGVRVETEGRDSLDGWQDLKQCIVVGTRGQLPACGFALKGPKDYELIASPERLTVCGFDERGAMFGLYNLEARMNLREGPFLPANLKTVRHSLYDARMAQSWLGWMEWPDAVLSHLAHDGFDGIYASVYANPNGDRNTVETSTDYLGRNLFLVRHQTSAQMRDLIDRASRYGIKVYAPIVHQYMGTPESETELRKLVRAVVKEFPEIQGYVLLTEGFWYKQWGGLHGMSKEYVEDWARNWCRAVAIVTEECHRVNPAIEVLPWEYNIDFRPENAEMKRYFIRQLPTDAIPLLTWENGKSFELDGLKGHLRDYSLNQIGPAEVTEAQIAEARPRGMKVYCKADTFATWQYGTFPYLPFPYQFYARYKAMEKFGVNGTMETWSSGYNPNFMTEFRAWYCWSDAPKPDELLGAIAARDFGPEGKEKVLKAWDHFSRAIRLVPDTGPYMGTNNAIGNPLFVEEPPLRTTTFTHSWTDHAKWMGDCGGNVNPYWPFTVSRMVFCPDFTNRSNRAEIYARGMFGVAASPNTKVLPVFLKYLRRASDEMEAGLKLQRAAALESPKSKRQRALRETVIAEQIQRMMQSDCAILEFEDLRLQWAKEKDPKKAAETLERMKTVLREEIERTEHSLLAATRDSRLGFQQEQDYVYTPYSLSEKLESLRETLEKLTLK
jgi:sugar phosphate isomerase/epimerase